MRLSVHSDVHLNATTNHVRCGTMTENMGGGPNTPPGWYRDAQGTTRWWDGSGWTEHVQHGTPPPTGGAPGQAFHAARAERPWYKKKRWWAAGVVAFFVIAGAVGGGTAGDEVTTASDTSESGSEPEKATNDGKPQKAKKKEPKDEPKEAPAEGAVAVTATQMLKDYEDNEAAADAKYKGKTLRISGKIAKIDTEILDEDEYVVEINGGGDFEFLSVSCEDQKAADVSSLSKGEDITVVADFEDGGDLGVLTENCTIL